GVDVGCASLAGPSGRRRTSVAGSQAPTVAHLGSSISTRTSVGVQATARPAMYSSPSVAHTTRTITGIGSRRGAARTPVSFMIRCRVAHDGGGVVNTVDLPPRRRFDPGPEATSA